MSIESIRHHLFARRLFTTLLYHHPLDPLPAIESAPGCRIALLDPAEQDLLLQIEAVDLAQVAGRLQSGQTCYVGSADGQPAHYSWVQCAGRHPVQATGRTVSIRPGEFWIYSCFTAAWARGRHLYPAVLARILHDYRKRGAAHAWIYVAEPNLASRKGIERAGFRLARKLRAVWLGRYWPLP